MMNNLTKEDIEKMNQAGKDLFGIDENLFTAFDEDIEKEQEKQDKSEQEEYVEMLKATQPKPITDYVDESKIEDLGNGCQKITMTLEEMLKMQLDDYKNKYIRAIADYENLKKHSDKQYKGAYLNGQASFVTDMLPFLDDFDRMKENGYDKVAFNILVKELDDLMKMNLVETIKPNDGDKFNEDFHDAVMIVPTDKKELDNHVKETMVKGYKHNGTGKVIRYATVSVYKYQE